MRIKQVDIKNFKFHHSLPFDIKAQNCLIYGENGTGKSSIYEALYSNFYYYKNTNIANDIFDIVGTFQHRDYSENTEVNILFNNQKEINRENNEVTDSELLENQTIYFANERLLREITEEDFYTLIQNSLKEHFPLLNNLHRIYLDWMRELNKPNNKKTSSETIEERIELDKQFKTQFFEYIPLTEINSIIKNDLNEKFQIEFNIGDSKIENKKLIYPTIQIKVKDIDDRGDFQNHFNEAKLKLIGIAIYFALAKKYETDSDLKLLVLDDFLTSLDMANRKLIIQYILENFGEYQKIILTHNIQFYNLILREIDTSEESEKWDIKKIFLSSLLEEETAMIRDDSISFLGNAKERLEAGDLQSSGNFLRKEFERIVQDFEILLELGKVEDMSNILDILKKPKVYYPKPHKTIFEFIKSIEEIFGYTMDDNSKLFKIEEKIQKIKECKIDLNRAETLEDGTVEQYSLSLSLQKTNFYNGILLNPLSHNDIEIEAYRKECLNVIELLDNINKGLKKLKGKRF